MFAMPTPLPKPRAIKLLSIPINLSFLDLSYTWNHTLYGLLLLASFSEQNIFESHQRFSMYQHFIPFYCLLSGHNTFFKIHVSVDVHLNSTSAYHDNVAMNTDVQVFGSYIFISLE